MLTRTASRTPAEDNYCYTQGVEKWDYLIGLRDYVNTYGSNLRVHDIIDPAKCADRHGVIVNRTAPTPNIATPAAPALPRRRRARRQPGAVPPTFADYQTELSAGQDVLLWMEPAPGYYAPETAHVVTGVGYNNAPVGAFHLGTLTVSDPWTHTTNAAPATCARASHTDGLLAPWQPKPDHDTSPQPRGTPID